MENPEEVLQALDEFQKLRPTEIPRELEDYLSWVAKTGDPVYQWALVKALFREKLQRVITDFYESCPSLDLAPCPNVEPFNYDAMRRTLVERLEAFVNAPFTVQRICELLTSPRKEYNRVDKFMRAIEKNILVVSTREPGGPSNNGRRSENGDNLVNGSLEDEDRPHHELQSGPGNEVDMDNWVKDCTSTAVPTLPEPESVENGLKDRLEPQISVAEATASSFVVSSSSDFSPVTSAVLPQVPPPSTPSPEDVAGVQSLAAVTHETAAAAVAAAAAAAAIIGDVSDAIMNEDTSSQPSLELESDGSDSNDSKKLQTTFQAKDFTLEEDEEEEEDSKSPVEAAAEEEKPSESLETADKESEQLLESSYTSEADGAAAENLNSTYKVDSADEPVDSEDEKVLLSEAQTSETSESEPVAPVDNPVEPVEDSLSSVKSDSEDSSGVDSSEAEKSEAKEDCKVESPEESVPSVAEPIEAPTSQPVEEAAAVEPAVEPIKPIADEPPVVETTDPSTTPKPESAELTIEETTEEVKPAKSIVPEPIPIVEEPKEAEPKDWPSPVIAEELAEEAAVAKNENSTEEESSKMVVSEEAVKLATESMEVEQDDEEPMEQETTTTTAAATASGEAMSS